MAASEIAHLGQMTSPLFTQEREVSANPFGVFGSQQAGTKRHPAAASIFKRGNPWQDTDLRSMGKFVRGVESSSSVAWSSLKNEQDREFESVRLSQLEKDKFCLNRKHVFMIFLKMNRNWLFTGSYQLRRDHLRLRLEWTEEIGNGALLMLPSMKLADRLNPREWSSM